MGRVLAGAARPALAQRAAKASDCDGFLAATYEGPPRQRKHRPDARLRPSAPPYQALARHRPQRGTHSNRLHLKSRAPPVPNLHRDTREATHLVLPSPPKFAPAGHATAGVPLRARRAWPASNLRGGARLAADHHRPSPDPPRRASPAHPPSPFCRTLPRNQHLLITLPSAPHPSPHRSLRCP